MTLFLLLALVARPEPAAGQPYTLVQIFETPPEFEAAFPSDINNRQQVVGLLRPLLPLQEAFNPRIDAFVWDSVSGLRLLNMGFVQQIFIDDAGVVYGVRNGRPFMWTDGTVVDLPMPSGETGVQIRTVTTNGIVLLRGRRSWAFHRGALVDLDALVGAEMWNDVWTINEQGAFGGCRDFRAYLRWPDGRLVEPWQTPCFRNPLTGGVTVLGGRGHFAGATEVFRGPTASDRDYYLHYAAPDGRSWTSGPQPSLAALGDMNSAGTLLGVFSVSPCCSFDIPFVFREGVVTDLRQAILNPPSLIAPGPMNDAGYIVGLFWVPGSFVPRAGLLVPQSLAAPPSLSFSIVGRTVTLAWQASFGASEYVLEAGSAPGLADLHVASVGAQLTLTTPAPPGRYYVRVRARSTTSTSGPSHEVIVDVP